MIQPADFGYEKARKIWNASIDKRPGIIARCAGVADVIAAVSFARENELKSLRNLSSPIVDMIQPMPFPQMQTLLDAAFPDGNHNYWKSTFLREFGDDAIVVLVEHANRAKSPLTGVVIEYYGGAASRVGFSETAFAQRQAQYSLAFLAQWTNPRESQVNIEWARALADSIRPFL